MARDPGEKDLAPRNGLDQSQSEAWVEATQVRSAEFADTEVNAHPQAGPRGAGDLASGSRGSRSAEGDWHPVATEPPQRIPSIRPDALTIEPFGPYRRIEVLTQQGSVGLVARGYNEAFGRWELLKFLREELKAEIEVVRQFRREGRVLAQLSHPNVVQVFAAHELGEQSCLAMEFLEGESLEALVRRTPGGMAVARACELLLDAARGLAAAHDVGLLHRDVKPDNMFVVSGARGKSQGLKLIDFGLATADRHRKDPERDPSLVSGTTGGTPLYMAPELWRGREATPRSDLYALGLSFYFALAGRLPFDHARVDDVRRAVLDPSPFASLRVFRADVPALLAAVIDRLVAKSGEDRFPSANALLGAVVSLTNSTRSRRVPGAGPYRGLLAFSAEERDVFFGRDRETAEICERLRSQGAVVLAGPSGSGKSSLAHAAVGPAVADGVLGGGLQFDVCRMEPRGRALRALLAAVAVPLGTPADALCAALDSEPARLGERLRAQMPAGRGLLVIVDQLEQLATLGLAEAEVQAFAQALSSCVDPFSSELRVVATVRADLMDRLFAVEPLRPLLARGFYPVPPLLGPALRLALEEPARAAGFRVEDPQILDDIVTEVGKSSALLPLASFAMSSWWERRDQAAALLSAGAWRELGGVAGALAHHADQVLATLSPVERRGAAAIAVALVSSHGTRALVLRSRLDDLALSGVGGARALTRLLESKLVTENDGEIQLVHDSLVRHWPWLVELLAHRQEDRAFVERLSAATRNWEEQDRADGALWSHDQANRLLRWFEGSETPLGQGELSFVDAVRRAEQRRVIVRRGMALAFAAVLAATAFFVTRRMQSLSEHLAELRQDGARAVQVHHQELGDLLGRNAELELPHDPASALRVALQSRALGPQPGLDLLAWKVMAAGLGVPLPPHRGRTVAVTFDPAGERLATLGEGGEIHLLGLDAPGGNRIQGRPSVRGQVRISADGRSLAYGTQEGELQIMEIQSRAVLASGRCPGKLVDLRWVGSEFLLAHCQGTGTSNAVRLPRRGSAAASVADAASLVAMGAEGQVVTYSSGTQRLEWIDAATGRVIASRRMERRVAALGVDTQYASLVADPEGNVACVETAEKKGAKGKLPVGVSGADPMVDRPLRWLPSPHREPVVGVWPLLSGARWITVDQGRVGVLWGRCSAGHCDAPLQPTDSFQLGGGVVRESANGRTVAVIGTDHDILLLSSDTGERMGRLALGSDQAEDLAFDADGRWLAVFTKSGTALAFSLELASVSRLVGPRMGTECLPAADASAFVCLEPMTGSLAAGASVTVRVSPAPGDRRVKEGVRAHPSLHRSGGGLSKSRLLAVGPRAELILLEMGDGSLALLTPAGTQALTRVGQSRVATTGPDGAWMVVGERDFFGNPALFRLDGTAVESLPAPEAVPSALAVSPEGRWLAVGSAPAGIQVIDMHEPSDPQRIKLPSAAQVKALEWADSDQLAAGMADGTVYAVRRTTRTANPVLAVAGSVVCVAWSKDQRGLVVGSHAGELSLGDLATGQGFPLVHLGALTGCVRAGTDDRFLMASRDGSVWQRRLNLAPLWTATAPELRGTPGEAGLRRWRGLAIEGDATLSEGDR